MMRCSAWGVVLSNMAWGLDSSGSPLSSVDWEDLGVALPDALDGRWWVQAAGQQGMHSAGFLWVQAEGW